MPITTQTLNDLLRNPQYSKQTHRHIFNVYKTLACMLALASSGALICLKYHIFGAGSSLLLFSLLLMLNFVPKKYKTFILYTCAFLFGTQAGQYIVIQQLPNTTDIVISALTGTSAMFACFSVSALLADRCSYLYLYGTVSTALIMLPVLSLLSYFLRISFLENLVLYLGVLVFSGYTVVDTQVILEKAEAGDRNVHMHAFELFTDFYHLFIHTLRLLVNRERRRRDN